MALPQDQIEDLAAQLDAAEREQRQIGQLSARDPTFTVGDAYAVQQAWVGLKLARGGRIKGHKIGLTSRAMQRAAQVDEPDHGVLLENMFYADGDTLPAARFIVPRVEVELAFVLRRDLAGPDCSLTDVLEATAYVMPALEIIDARIERLDATSGRPRTVLDTIADNAANAAVVLGGRPVRPLDIDLRWAAAVLYRNAVIEDTGVAAAVLNHPANGPAWLARKLHPYGAGLQAGQIVLGGSFTSPIDARPGDAFHADFGPLGAISVRFA